MNRTLLLDIVIVSLFVINLYIIGTLSQLSLIGIKQAHSVNPELFDDSVLSFDFLYLVVHCTVPLLLFWLFLILMREGSINLRKKGDAQK